MMTETEAKPAVDLNALVQTIGAALEAAYNAEAAADAKVIVAALSALTHAIAAKI